MKVQAKTVRDVLVSLLSDHVEHHDPDLPHVAGRVDGTEADVEHVEQIASSTPAFRLELTDGSKFRVEVHAI